MKPLLLLLSLMLVAPTHAQPAPEAAGTGTYSFKLLLDGQPIAWDVGEGVSRNGEFFVIDDASAPLEVYFEGGRLELELADFGTFSHPHVTGVRFQRGSDPSTMSLGATVRHADQEGDYTDTIVFEGADGGRLALTEPLGGPEPFTRSKDNLTVTGPVQFSALDTVRSGEGSIIVLDFGHAPFAQLERGNLRYELTLEPEN